MPVPADEDLDDAAAAHVRSDAFVAALPGAGAVVVEFLLPRAADAAACLAEAEDDEGRRSSESRSCRRRAVAMLRQKTSARPAASARPPASHDTRPPAHASK